MDSVCGWGGDPGCETPRSCYNCLNDANSTCGIDSSGACIAVTSKGLEFTSSTNRYCEDHDSVCSACRSSWATAGQDASFNATCRGENGCVCLASCHRFTRSQDLRQQSAWCASALTPTSTPPTVWIQVGEYSFLENMSEEKQLLIYLLIFGILMLILGCCCWCCVRCVRSSKAKKLVRRQEAQHYAQEVVYAVYPSPLPVDPEAQRQPTFK